MPPLNAVEEKTIQEENAEILKALVQKCGPKFFVQGYSPRDDEVLGIVISQYFHWDGLQIAKTAYEALEDANFHTLSAEFAELCQKHSLDVG